jgi:hypothetical protein
MQFYMASRMKLINPNLKIMIIKRRFFFQVREIISYLIRYNLEFIIGM